MAKLPVINQNFLCRYVVIGCCSLMAAAGCSTLAPISVNSPASNSFTSSDNVTPRNATVPVASRTRASAADGWAIVVGVSRYKHAGTNFGNLSFAASDAQRFYDHLVGEAGWPADRVVLLLDEEATLSRVQAEFNQRLLNTDSRDKVIVFWAGHGFPDNQGRYAFFACHDTRLGRSSSGIMMHSLAEQIHASDPANVMLFVDTCHAGSIMSRNPGRQDSLSVPPGWVYFLGSETDQAAFEQEDVSGQSGGGRLTDFVLSGLRGAADGFEPNQMAERSTLGSSYRMPKPRQKPDSLITVGELRGYVSSRSYVLNTELNRTNNGLYQSSINITSTHSTNPRLWNMDVNYPR
ncbi:MAG: caspase family protein [Planctomycetota bacterium]